MTEIVPNVCVSVQEICKWNEDSFEDISESELSSNNDASDDGEENAVVATPVISHLTAIESVNNLLKWCKNHEPISSKYTSSLLALRNKHYGLFDKIKLIISFKLI